MDIISQIETIICDYSWVYAGKEAVFSSEDHALWESMGPSAPPPEDVLRLRGLLGRLNLALGLTRYVERSSGLRG
jgi:hypothetical protein